MKPILCLILLLHCFVSFGQPPTASFTVSDFEICVGQPLTLTSTSTAGAAAITNYFWSTPGGQPESAEGSNTTFTTSYQTPGTYNLSLIVQSADGLSDGELKLGVLVVHANPLADITELITSCEAPFQVNYGTGSSATGSHITYSWTFAGGSPVSATGGNPQVSYASSGTFNSSLTVLNTTTGCNTTISKPVTLSDYRADFQLPASACLGDTIAGNDLSSAGTNNWSWTFTGGTSPNSGIQKAFFIAENIGSQTMTLTATNTLTGCTGTISKTILIHDLPLPDFVSNFTDACKNDLIQFTNTSSLTGATFEWDFGDGQTFSGANPPDHGFSADGDYSVSLKMTDANGCQQIKAKTIHIWNAVANFSLDFYDGCAPALVSFTDLSVSPRSITGWQWDFGDGSTSNQPNPTHTFLCGRYDVKLIITTAGTCTDTVSLSSTPILNLNPTLGLTTLPDDNDANDHNDTMIAYGEKVAKPDFTFDKRVFCAWSEPVNLTAIAQINCPFNRGEVLYQWYFNGIPQDRPDTVSIQKIFRDTLKNGPVDVGLEVNFRNCISDKKDSLDLFWLKAPFADVYADNLFCNKGNNITIEFLDDESVYGHANTINFDGQTIQNQASDDVQVTYSWGDGTPNDVITDDTQLEDIDKGHIFHTFTDYGTFHVQQVIENLTLGCRSEKDLYIYISYLTLDVVPDSICVGESIDYQLIIGTPPVHGIVQYQYLLHNDSLYTPTPGYINTYPTAGVYNEHFEVINAGGCSAGKTQQFTVFDIPVANITALADSVCDQEAALVNPTGSTFGTFASSTNGWDHFDWRFDDGTTDQTTTDFSNVATNPLDLGDKVRVIMTATDNFGCVSKPDTIHIFTQKPTASYSSKIPFCDGVDELIDGHLSKGNGPLTFSWYQDGVLQSVNNDSITFNIQVNPPDLTSQDHVFSLIVSDNHGCTDTLTQTIPVRNPIIEGITYTTEGTSVDGAGNYTCPPVVVNFDIQTQSTDAISSYAWSLGNDFDTDVDSDKEDPQGVQYHFAGEYAFEVTIMDVNGCPATYSENPFLVIGGPSAKPIITLDPLDPCKQNYLFQVTDTNSMTGWIWDLGDGTTVSSLDFPDGSFSHQYGAVSTYEPVLTVQDTTPPPGCSVPYGGLVVMQGIGLDAFFTADPLQINIGQEVLLDDGSTFTNSPIVTWVWNYGDGQVDSLGNNQSFSHQYMIDGDIPIVLTVIDQNGCTDQYMLKIHSELVFTTPNVITQIGTGGVNSIWTLYADIFTDFRIIILNRWGNVVYEGSRKSNDPRYLWDGVDYKSGKHVSDGTYFWIIEGTLFNGKQIKEHGYLQVFNP